MGLIDLSLESVCKLQHVFFVVVVVFLIQIDLVLGSDLDVTDLTN